MSGNSHCLAALGLGRRLFPGQVSSSLMEAVGLLGLRVSRSCTTDLTVCTHALSRLTLLLWELTDAGVSGKQTEGF